MVDAGSVRDSAIKRRQLLELQQARLTGVLQVVECLSQVEAIAIAEAPRERLAPAGRKIGGGPSNGGRVPARPLVMPLDAPHAAEL
ncbi:hypothetical protein [Arthrobacter sp. D5-1]|jgi:hypothetical protein|uniref:hypothetical protein n=1 Tax=Arthrobacter sp. D5-1 TaxID=1477518 RepID=UPI0005B78A6D|nr:hypothetical protein [Arthrobacter sp. D5-1]QSZ51281.1 hypothetical protein AYX22_22360 [Arthrobacter sp. D5-1]